MSFDEAAELTAFPDIRNNANIVSLDELWWFTGVTAIPHVTTCASLKSVRIPQNSAGGITESFCSGCGQLESIEFSAGVTRLSSGGNTDVLAHLPKLKSLIFHSSVAPVLTGYTLYNITTTGTIYVPVGATGYDTGDWRTKLLDKGWTIKYTL